MFPHFKVAKRVMDSEGTCLIGTLDTVKYGREFWIKDNWIGYLRIESVFIKGRWNRIGELWYFRIPSQVDADRIKERSEFDVFPSYWGQRAEIALNDNRQWKRTVFQVVGNCDHHHCDICWIKIWLPENREYMRSDDKLNICLSCYERVVVPRSVESLPGFPKSDDIS